MKKTWKLFGIFTLFMPLKSFVAPIMLRVKKQAVTPLRDMPDRCGEPKKAIYLVRVDLCRICLMGTVQRRV
ncbi:hypothetical protein ABLT32_05795 [Bacteroides pyogenes]|uniref:hypothetical protein n=1 Tax=Bacteroides pyogenes TaxID=310300 RepID=UPI002FDB0D2B